MECRGTVRVVRQAHHDSLRWRETKNPSENRGAVKRLSVFKLDNSNVSCVQTFFTVLYFESHLIILADLIQEA